MREITSIEPQRRRKWRVNVFLEGEFAFSLSAELAQREGLHPGMTLPQYGIDGLLRESEAEVCCEAAIRYLSYRPRSESEMKDRLERRGFERETIEAVISTLKERGLLDDRSFARFWREDRERFSPRGMLLLKSELRRKGIAPETIEEVTSDLDEGEDAYRAARKKAMAIKETDYRLFQGRLGSFLRRRGFSYDVINRTVDRVWRERLLDSPASEE